MMSLTSGFNAGIRQRHSVHMPQFSRSLGNKIIAASALWLPLIGNRPESCIAPSFTYKSCPYQSQRCAVQFRQHHTQSYTSARLATDVAIKPHLVGLPTWSRPFVSRPHLDTTPNWVSWPRQTLTQSWPSILWECGCRNF
jgi:hypothetical protein